MGIHVIKMPDIGEGIAEVELVEWHVQPGDTVTEDQTLADVMTDKANVEIPTPVAGKVIALGGKPGDVLAVGAELIRIETEGAGNVVDVAPAPRRAEPEAAAPDLSAAAPDPSAAAPGPSAAAPDLSAAAVGGAPAAAASAPASPRTIAPRAANVAAPPPLHAADATRDVPAPRPAPAAAPPSAGTNAPPRRAPGEKPIATPAVRRRAWDLGIELQFVHGTGPDGRIMHEDLDAFLAQGAGAPDVHMGGIRYVERTDEEAVPVIGLRRRIAQKMQEAKRRIPHFTYVEEVDVTELEALRARLNASWGASRGRLTVLPFLMRAIVRAMHAFPQINARYDDDSGTVTRYGAVHIGIATQTEGGLMVPVVRHAEARGLWSCAAEVGRLSEAARAGKALREELLGSTISITSLGPLGGIVTTPIINYPEVAIVGVNRIVERPVIRAGAIVPRLIMNLSSSFDHRVVDGLDGAEFVQSLRGYLESPATLFIE